MKQNIVASLIIVAGFLSGAYFFPWSSVNWGNLHLSSPRTITIGGYASSSVSNETASFYAGTSATNDDKNAAISQVNAQMEKTLAALKTFGIPEKDIKTSNISVYQDQDYYYDDQGARKTRPGQWQVNNSITVKLRNTDQVSELNTVLINSGLTNVSGPDFSLDNARADGELVARAIDDARDRAETIAKAENMAIGEVLSVREGGVSTDYGLRLASGFSGGMGGGEGAPVSPGSSKIQTSVVVTFELR